jgi:AmiR/NasT family two-component response regulator
MARILLVEDDPLVRHGFVTQLTAGGHSVVAVATGQAAITAATATAPDLAVLDVGLPDIDGIQCARRLRELKLWMPIIFLTAYDGAEFVARAIEQQAYAYLVKPIAGAQLLPLIQTALSISTAEREKEQKILAALADSREISAAVGMIAERHGWSVDDAFQALRLMARNESRKIVDVAAELTSKSRSVK